MVDSSRFKPDDVDQLLLNAQLRDELEPYFDESVNRVNLEQLPTRVENEFLASMLEWERAPILPISRWFDPELKLPRPETLNNDELREVLYDVVQKLFEKRIVLDFTDHLSDRELYCLIYRDILPSREKMIDSPRWLHWDCANVTGDPEIWLRYYASESERQDWAASTRRPLPPASPLPHPRRLPGRPL